ncbi:MAG: hypothetical protein RIC19_17025 [Phaeodactylibacter sp.]|uniref:hypothetical protein n=1 Tax=Phaeodactylibacter sp. TaxID=1940289 RepID=UPI0032ECFC25
MTTEAQLSDWKRTWRTLITESMGRAFDSIEDRLPAECPKANELLLLKAQLNEANRAKVMGVKSSEDLQLDYNRIRLNLLEWIDGLEVADFSPPSAGMKPKGQGVLLHKIPRQMEVGREEICVIRLAYDRAVIADNLELTDAVEVKEVKVSEVMEAELIDANSEPAFHIRTYHDERQFLEDDTYTEWKFYVEPIREGTFRLLLKLTVIEEVMGAREHRNITWEEQVQIVTEAGATAPATFTVSGIALTTADTAPLSPRTLTGGGKAGAPSPSRSAKKEPSKDWHDVVPQEPGQPPSPAPVTALPKRRSLSRRLSIAASLILIVGFGGLYWMSSGSMNTTEQATPNEEQPGRVVEPAVDEPADLQWSGNLSDRRPRRTAPLPPRPQATAIFEVCVAASGEVVDVKPMKNRGNDGAWTAQMAKSLRQWTFEPATGETCGSVTYRPE